MTQVGGLQAGGLLCGVGPTEVGGTEPRLGCPWTAPAATPLHPAPSPPTIASLSRPPCSARLWLHALRPGAPAVHGARRDWAGPGRRRRGAGHPRRGQRLGGKGGGLPGLLAAVCPLFFCGVRRHGAAAALASCFDAAAWRPPVARELAQWRACGSSAVLPPTPAPHPADLHPERHAGAPRPRRTALQPQGRRGRGRKPTALAPCSSWGPARLESPRHVAGFQHWCKAVCLICCRGTTTSTLSTCRRPRVSQPEAHRRQHSTGPVCEHPLQRTTAADSHTRCAAPLALQEPRAAPAAAQWSTSGAKRWG